MPLAQLLLACVASNARTKGGLATIESRTDPAFPSRPGRAISQEDRHAAEQKINLVEAKLRSMKLNKAADKIRDGAHETLSYYAFPSEHWRSLRTNSPLERIMREIRRRTRVVGSFPDGESALMLVAARLRHIAGTRWGTKRYMNMQRLWDLDQEALA